eukprot:g7059.t1
METLLVKLLSLTKVIQTIGETYPSQELGIMTEELGAQLESVRPIAQRIGIYYQVCGTPIAVKIRDQFLQTCHTIGTLLERINSLLIDLDSSHVFTSPYCDDLKDLATSFQDMECPYQEINDRIYWKTKRWALQLEDRQISQWDALNLINEYLEQTIGVEKLNEDWRRVLMLFLHDIHSARCRGDETEEHYLRLIFWAINGVNSPPPEFLCPITLQLLHDPVILTETEVTYEKKNIINWMVENESKTCPVSQKRVEEMHLVQNRALKAIVEDWCRGGDVETRGVQRSMETEQRKFNLLRNSTRSEISELISESGDSINRNFTPSNSEDTWENQTISSTPITAIPPTESSTLSAIRTPSFQQRPIRESIYESGSSESSSQTSKTNSTSMSKVLRNQVLQAIETSDVSLLEELYQDKSCDFNHEDESGLNFLHISCICGQANVVEFLISKGLSSRSKTKFDASYPLILAASNGHPSCVAMLLNKGARLISQDKRGWTALHAACDQGNLEVVEILVEFGLDHDLRFQDVRSENGWTALHCAARRGNDDVFKLLIKGKCNINEKCEAGETPLHMAVEFGHKSIVALILDHPKLDVNIASNDGRTALHRAVDRNDQVIGQWLIEKGINVNAVSTDGMTALHRAAYSNKMSIGKILVEEGRADVRIKTNDGKKAIQFAAENRNSEFHTYLHWKGIQARIKRKKKSLN